MEVLWIGSSSGRGRQVVRKELARYVVVRRSHVHSCHEETNLVDGMSLPVSESISPTVSYH